MWCGCEIDWAEVRGWIEAGATAATALIAWAAYRAWLPQLRGSSKHAAAAAILEAARLMRYHFYDARSPWISAGEFPPAYRATVAHSSEEEAGGYAHVYEGRWKHLGPQIQQLATLRAKAGALLGDDVADALEGVARKARELHNFMTDSVAQYRAGPEIVREWDQEWVELVKKSVKADPSRDDKYSKEFEEKFAALENLLRPHL